MQTHNVVIYVSQPECSNDDNYYEFNELKSY